MAIEQLTIGQVAARYGVSVDVVRRRIRGGFLPARRDNHGQWWLELDTDAPPPPALVPTRPPGGTHIAPPAAAMPPPSAPGAAEVAELRERLAAELTRRAETAEAALATTQGELREEREARRKAEATAADATRQKGEAERAGLEGWRTAAELASRLVATSPLPAPLPVRPSPAPPRRRGLLTRLFG